MVVWLDGSSGRDVRRKLMRLLRGKIAVSHTAFSANGQQLYSDDARHTYVAYKLCLFHPG